MSTSINLRSDNAKLIDKLKSQIKINTFVTQTVLWKCFNGKKTVCKTSVPTRICKDILKPSLRCLHLKQSFHPCIENQSCQSRNRVLSHIIRVNSWSKVLCFMATLLISVSTDFSLVMTVRILVTLLKSRLRRSIQLVFYIVTVSPIHSSNKSYLWPQKITYNDL